ncbi:MAG: hypothetical protein V3V92_06415, partial [Candidatus Hydrothermarchaeales archaeon]
EEFQITSEGKYSHPSWSPDGNKIAYTANQGEDNSIWISKLKLTRFEGELITSEANARDAIDYAANELGDVRDKVSEFDSKGGITDEMSRNIGRLLEDSLHILGKAETSYAMGEYGGAIEYSSIVLRNINSIYNILDPEIEFPGTSPPTSGQLQEKAKRELLEIESRRLDVIGLYGRALNEGIDVTAQEEDFQRANEMVARAREDYKEGNYRQVLMTAEVARDVLAHVEISLAEDLGLVQEAMVVEPDWKPIGAFLVAISVILLAAALFSKRVGLKAPRKPEPNTGDIDVQLDFPEDLAYQGVGARIYARVVNKGEEPLDDVAISAKFPDALDVGEDTINFGFLPPNDIVQGHWSFKPKMVGTFTIFEPTLTFKDKSGKKKALQLDSLRVEVKEEKEVKKTPVERAKRRRKALVSPWCPECNKYKGREPECPHCGYKEE